jgi:hypothetical protein
MKLERSLAQIIIQSDRPPADRRLGESGRVRRKSRQTVPTFATLYLLFRGQDTSLAWMICFRTIYLALAVLLFGSCGGTEQTPGPLGQKLEEGIEGNGTIVPEDKDRSQSGPSDNSPVTKPAGVPQS